MTVTPATYLHGLPRATDPVGERDASYHLNNAVQAGDRFTVVRDTFLNLLDDNWNVTGRVIVTAGSVVVAVGGTRNAGTCGITVNVEDPATGAMRPVSAGILRRAA